MLAVTARSSEQNHLQGKMNYRFDAQSRPRFDSFITAAMYSYLTGSCLTLQQVFNYVRGKTTNRGILLVVVGAKKKNMGSISSGITV